MRWPEVAAKQRRERQDSKAFDLLIATPATAAFAMPANAIIRFVSRAGCAAGTTAATIAGATARTIKTPLLAAGGVVKLDRVEKKFTVTPVSGFDVEVDIGLGEWRKICGIA
jgi:hypothetical protein